MLACFAARHGITYPLLSDAGAAAIHRLGLTNQHLAEQQASYGVPVRDFQQGVPYPGVFVLDAHGVVVDKRFEQSYRYRPTAAAWVEEWAGGPPTAAVSTRAEGPGLRATASLDAAVYRPYQVLRLRVALECAPGTHVYGAPTPEGYTPLAVTIEPFEGLAAQPAQAPAPRPFRVEGLDEHFRVHDGTVDVVVPFGIDGNAGDLTIGVTVDYQACTAIECFPPSRLRLELPLSVQDLIRD